MQFCYLTRFVGAKPPRRIQSASHIPPWPPSVCPLVPAVLVAGMNFDDSYLENFPICLRAAKVQ